MTSRASLRLSPRLLQFKCCNMSHTPDVFRSLLPGDEPAARPVLDHFELIDCAFIVGVPCRISILK